jgi:anti-anti-sigma factor
VAKVACTRRPAVRNYDDVSALADCAHCNGKLVAETAEFFKTETSRAIECSTIVVLDLADLAYLDSSGLRALAGVFATARNATREMPRSERDAG